MIREKSIHSNRAAPSLDIARAFAQTDRLRHLASGGMFLIFTEECVVEGPRKQITLRRPPFSAASSRWASYGSKARHLLNAQSTVCRYLGIATQEENCMYMHSPSKDVNQLMMLARFVQAQCKEDLQILGTTCWEGAAFGLQCHQRVPRMHDERTEEWRPLFCGEFCRRC